MIGGLSLFLFNNYRKPVMKLFKLILLSYCCLMASHLFAQSPKNIEADLLKSFKRIQYWNGQKDKDTTMAAFDSLDVANERFGKKLQRYTNKYPFTINYKYPDFSNTLLTINQSPDGNFAIYSWDTQTGGTMHYFCQRTAI